jgi:hypothetical protein
MKFDLEVRRDDVRAIRFLADSAPVVRDGQALIRIDRFGCTANNILYAKLGEWLYWKFFPAERGWGRLPAWGVGEVVDSGMPDLKPGTRVFGCVPMASHLLVAPTRVGNARFVDGSEHRAGLPPAYSTYALLPDGDTEADDLQMLLRPLYLTAFLLVDLIESEGVFGAGTVLVSSASSKTSLGVAWLLAGLGIRTTGLTSKANLAFVERLGVYDDVIDYDSVAALPKAPAVFVDVAGSVKVRQAVHTHYGEHLTHSAKVGSTHWDAPPDAEDPADLPGPAPTLFFAPDRIKARTKDWGADGLNRRFAVVWDALARWTATWLTVDHGEGPRAVRTVYFDNVEGRVPPDRAHVLRL